MCCRLGWNLGGISGRQFYGDVYIEMEVDQFVSDHPYSWSVSRLLEALQNIRVLHSALSVLSYCVMFDIDKDCLTS